MKIIARIHNDFDSKFGIPRQSNVVKELAGTIVFEPEYRDASALRGIEGFDYLWLIWGFSANRHAATSPVVRPPLLGGNVRMGVFATRSPFRPNGLGLSSVRISELELDAPNGPLVHVLGADLMDGTPIYDIKPYVVYADSHPDARSGFVDSHAIRRLEVEMSDDVVSAFTKEELESLRGVLELDPRPQYQDIPEKVYGMLFAGKNVKFRVSDGVVRVVGVE